MTLQVQVDLKGRYSNVHMTTWVDVSKPFKVGDYITLKDYFPANQYQVLRIYGTIDKHDIKQKWNVGGL